METQMISNPGDWNRFLARVTRGTTISRCALTIALVVGALIMAACGGPQLHGKYFTAKQPGVQFSGLVESQIEFKSGNKANVIVGVFGMKGPTQEVDYEVHGNEVTIKSAQGTMVATIAGDGCLDFGGAFGKLCKRPEQRAHQIVRPEGTALARAHTASMKSEAYDASMKSDLRNLVTAEEAYFADSVKYSSRIACAHPPRRGAVAFCASVGNVLGPLTVGSGTEAGWSANIKNANTPRSCAIYVGTVTPLAPATRNGREGQPVCSSVL
jgi:hypothetical protein